MAGIQAARSVWRKARGYGAAYIFRRLREKGRERLLHPYDRAQRAHAPDEAALAWQRAHQPDAGLISIVVPVYNTDPRMLSEMLDSFLAQTYTAWEACLYDASTREETREVLRGYMARDERIRAVFSDVNDGISGNTNHALALARGEWIALCDHDDLYTPDALWRVAERIAAEAPDVVYTDEDKISEDSRYLSDPHYKPDFCPDNLRSSNYVCHLICVRRSLMEAVGGERSAFDGSQDHDLTLRCAEQTDRISHVPEICYHWRTVRSSESHQHLDSCFDAACRATEEHMAHIGYPGEARREGSVVRLTYQLPRDRSLDIILLSAPGRDSASLRAAIGRFGWQAVLHEARRDSPQSVQEALRQCRQRFVLLMDTRLRIDSAGFADEMMMYAQREDAAAVTPVILDRRKRIVHAGYAVDSSGGCHGRNRNLRLTAAGFHLMALRSHNVSAVSSLCLMARREALSSLDTGWDSLEAAVTAWCLRAQLDGLRSVYTPAARAVLPEKAPENGPTAADARRLAALLPEGWHDPCWNIHLDIEKTDWSLKEG